MFVLADVDSSEDIDLPIPDELVVTLSESKDLFYALLDSLPKMFQNNNMNYNKSAFFLGLDVINLLLFKISFCARNHEKIIPSFYGFLFLFWRFFYGTEWLTNSTKYVLFVALSTNCFIETDGE